MKFLDLFSGVGGFRLGMEDHECIGSCEIDKYARETYKKNFGLYPEYNDVRLINPNDLTDFDVITAGFPCQAFSISGRRLGFEDTRGTLFFEIARIAQEKRPQILFLENVKGLLSHDKGNTFRTILTILDEIGYDAEWQIINSKYFVPQNRERLFIIGHLRGSSTRKVFPLGEDGKDHIEPQIEYIKNSTDDSYRIYNPDGIDRSLRANSGGMGSKTGVYAVTSNRGKLTPRETSTCLNANYWKGGYDFHGARTMIYISQVNQNMKQRIQKRDNTWTLTNNGGDFGLLEGHRIRRLTPLETERLQGFPDNWTKGVSDTQRYKQMGNAVTVPVVKYIAKHL